MSTTSSEPLPSAAMNNLLPSTSTSMWSMRPLTPGRTMDAACTRGGSCAGAVPAHRRMARTGKTPVQWRRAASEWRWLNTAVPRAAGAAVNDGIDEQAGDRGREHDDRLLQPLEAEQQGDGGESDGNGGQIDDRTPR